jgi:hypothetical protein
VTIKILTHIRAIKETPIEVVSGGRIRGDGSVDLADQSTT